MNPVTRRTFLKSSALFTATAAFSARSWSQVAGANSDIRVGVIGLKSRGGNSHVPSLQKISGVRLVALCDADTAMLDRAKKRVGGDVKTFVDLREMLASRDIDAVTIATPNHLHSLQAIWACEAGKDVYVEKPVSHNVWEGRQLVSAAAKHNRVVQAGTQIRSGVGLQEAVAWVQAGNLGKITAARGFCYKNRPSIGKVNGPQKVPATVNYDLWCGPAPMDALMRKELHYDWHWVHVTGNGDIGNQGIHQMDVARWFLGEKGLPRHTLSIGGRLGYIDDGDTPNTQVIIHDYASAPLIFEVRGLPTSVGARGPGSMDKYRGVSVGNVIDCEGGSVVTTEYFTATAFDKSGKVVKEFTGKDRHMQNFIDVVRSRKTADLHGPILEGHVSSALCHLGNISHVLGKAAAPAEVQEKVKGNRSLAEAYGRMSAHLASNAVDYAKTPLIFGAPLTLARNAKGETMESFTGEFATEATPLLTRKYREPFAVKNYANEKPVAAL
jgi:predicted dehydrogenase